MIEIDKTKYKKVHSRQIDINTYDCGSDAVIVEGRLKDDRFQKIYRSTGESVPPGTVHHMIIRMKVRSPELTIEDIDVDMPTAPHAECAQTRTSLEPVKGMKITSGFTNNVKDRVGGVKGCAHLIALLVSMASAAVQGSWAAVAAQPVNPAIYFDKTMKVMINTCRVWRADGPMFKKYRGKFKSSS